MSSFNHNNNNTSNYLNNRRNNITLGCEHKPHTRFVKLTNTTYCLRCAPPLASELEDERYAASPIIKKASSSSSSSTKITSVSITEMLRDSENLLREIEKSRRLALCCLAEELTLKDLEEIRTNAKSKVDETMLNILRRLEQVQKKLHSDVDQIVDSRISKYSRVKKLVEECDQISSEVAEPLSWRGSYDHTASILASLRLEELVQNSNDEQQSDNSFSSSSKNSSISSEITSLLKDLHKTLDLEIESRTKRFALDETDLSISVKESELDMPFDEFAAATERSMQKKNKYDYQDRDIDGRQRDLDQEAERNDLLRRVEPKHSHSPYLYHNHHSHSSSQPSLLSSRTYRDELLGRSVTNDERIRAEQKKLNDEYSPTKFMARSGVKW